MAKKHGLGTVLLIGAAAAAVAGGVISYVKRAEIKRLAEDIITRVKPMDTRSVYTVDFDGDGEPDAVMADWDGDGSIAIMAGATGEPNIVESGISLESVEKTERDNAEPEDGDTEAGQGAESEPEEAAGADDFEETEGNDAHEAVPEGGEETGRGDEPTGDTDGEIRRESRKKKVRFWSK